MSNRKAKPLKQSLKPALSKRKTVAAPPKPLGYSYERAARENGITEKPAPMLRVPGMRNAKWDREIGRHVVGLIKSDFQRQLEMDAMVW